MKLTFIFLIAQVACLHSVLALPTFELFETKSALTVPEKAHLRPDLPKSRNSLINTPSKLCLTHNCIGQQLKHTQYWQPPKSLASYRYMTNERVHFGSNFFGYGVHHMRDKDGVVRYFMTYRDGQSASDIGYYVPKSVGANLADG